MEVEVATTKAEEVMKKEKEISQAKEEGCMKLEVQLTWTALETKALKATYNEKLLRLSNALRLGFEKCAKHKGRTGFKSMRHRSTRSISSLSLVRKMKSRMRRVSQPNWWNYDPSTIE